MTGEKARLVRVFLGEADRYRHGVLYKAIVEQARAAGLAGATVLRGLYSYGTSSRIHTAGVLDFSAELPVVVEIVDVAANIDRFLPVLTGMIEEAGSGGLVTSESVDVVRCAPGRRTTRKEEGA